MTFTPLGRASACVDESDVVPRLLAACPSFREPWTAYVSAPEYEPGLLYIDLGEFARHLVDLMRRNDTPEFSAVFSAVEDLHLNGTPFVREAATVGLLEDLQNIAGNTDVDPCRFRPFLRGETRKWWDKLNRFWDGEVGALREDSD